jgi:hypothetical protein
MVISHATSTIDVPAHLSVCHVSNFFQFDNERTKLELLTFRDENHTRPNIKGQKYISVLQYSYAHFQLREGYLNQKLHFGKKYFLDMKYTISWL